MHIDTLREETKCYINPNISIDNINFIEVKPESVGEYTEVKDIYKNMIFENMRVNQKGTLTGDETDFTGTVKKLEGCWLIVNDEDNDAVNLWDETRENRILD